MDDIIPMIVMHVAIFGMLVCGAFLDSESFMVFLIGLIMCALIGLVAALVMGATNFFDDGED